MSLIQIPVTYLANLPVKEGSKYWAVVNDHYCFIEVSEQGFFRINFTGLSHKKYLISDDSGSIPIELSSEESIFRFLPAGEKMYIRNNDGSWVESKSKGRRPMYELVINVKEIYEKHGITPEIYQIKKARA